MPAPASAQLTIFFIFFPLSSQQMLPGSNHNPPRSSASSKTSGSTSPSHKPAPLWITGSAMAGSSSSSGGGGVFSSKAASLIQPINSDDSLPPAPPQPTVSDAARRLALALVRAYLRALQTQPVATRAAAR